jgi:methylmalonyl-CoA/ethylmalonyl-CoA epimerase
MKILGLHHVAIATDSLDKHVSILEDLFGLKGLPPQANPTNELRLAFVDVLNTEIEYVEPLDKNSPISKFLGKRGPAIHHICLLVDDIEEALEELKAKKVRLIDEKPRNGAAGSCIAFIHPESTGGILIELKQSKL